MTMTTPTRYRRRSWSHGASRLLSLLVCILPLLLLLLSLLLQTTGYNAMGPLIRATFG